MIRAVYDACVLYPASLRDLLLYLAYADAVFPVWSNEIHNEWIRNLLKNRNDLSPTSLERTRQVMDQKFPHSLVEGYQPLIQTLHLPDSNDRHVLAVAIHAEASLIVTFNLGDFPREILTSHNIEAISPDFFIQRLIDIDAKRICSAVATHRANLKRPPKTVDEYLETLRRQKLPRTVAFLEQHRNEI